MLTVYLSPYYLSREKRKPLTRRKWGREERKKERDVTLNKNDKKEIQQYLDTVGPAQSRFRHIHRGVATYARRRAVNLAGHVSHWIQLHDRHGVLLDLYSRRDRKAPPTVAGTVVNWGTEAPDPSVVLEYYKKAEFPLPDSGSEASGSSSGGDAWKKNVQFDGGSGYFYFDPNWEYVSCDAQGNEIYYAT